MFSAKSGRSKVFWLHEQFFSNVSSVTSVTSGRTEHHNKLLFLIDQSTILTDPDRNRRFPRHCCESVNIYFGSGPELRIRIHNTASREDRQLVPGTSVDWCSKLCFFRVQKSLRVQSVCAPPASVGSTSDSASWRRGRRTTPPAAAAGAVAAAKRRRRTVRSKSTGQTTR